MMMKTNPLVYLLLTIIGLLVAGASVEFSDELSALGKLRVPSGQPVENSPGEPPGSIVACNRIHFSGLARLLNLRKFANSRKIRVSVEQSDGFLRPKAVEVCLHGNSSIGLGMCPTSQWRKLNKGSWMHSSSPYANMILDIRRPINFSSPIGVYTDEEFVLHRVVFLVVGMVLMVLARVLSKSVVFYYGSAMTVGIILVILMILFQGMRLLPTGRKSSLAIFMYSSIVGAATTLIHYVSGLLRSILVEIGVGEEMYNPLGVFLLVCLVLAGAWCGYWGVRKLVLTEEGLVDSGVAYFVEWATMIFSGVMILQCSLDVLLAVEALVVAITISFIIRTRGKLRFFRRLFRKMMKNIKRTKVQVPASEYFDTEDSHQIQKSGSRFGRSQFKHSKLTSHTSSVHGSARTPQPMSSNKETFYSTFHNTPERKRFSDEEWDNFTKDQTSRALRGLVTSPDFNRWALVNAEKLTLTPPGYNNHQKRTTRFFWF